ncbi:MAG: S8 family serine peptidase [Thermoanaerobaculia bacterium]
MNGHMMEAARAEVRNKFGAALEAKASDQMIIKLAGLSLPGAEAAIPTQGAILEFHPENLGERARTAQAAIEEMPTYRQFQESIREAAPEVRRQSSSHSLVRAHLVQDAKSRFHQNSRSVREALEKAESATVGAAAIEAAGPAGPVVETCWLNGTMRSVSTSPALAEVAGDENLKYLDVPRRLVLDISETPGVIGAPALRQQSETTGEGIVVAVIDTEVAVAHPAFGGRAEQKANLSSQALGSPSRHGTGVAGIIASEDSEFTGVAPGATIFAYKIFPSGTDFEGALAIQTALENGAHVANCSWGAGLASDGTSREAVACNNAWGLGLTIVKSAGNRGPGGQTLTTPADAEGVIVVGATGRDGSRVEDYSSRGPTSDGRHRPHLVAPGGTRFVQGITSTAPLGGFADAGPGTSFATAHVSGLLALLLEADPVLGPDELRTAILASCTPLAGGAVDDQGSGLPGF